MQCWIIILVEMLLFPLKLWITSSTRLRFGTSRWRRKIRMPHPGNLSVILQVCLAVQTSSKPAITGKVLVTALCFTWERNLHRRSDPKVHRGWYVLINKRWHQTAIKTTFGLLNTTLEKVVLSFFTNTFISRTTASDDGSLFHSRTISEKIITDNLI